MLTEHPSVDEAVRVINSRPVLTRMASEAAALAHELTAAARILGARVVVGDDGGATRIPCWLPHGAPLPEGTRGGGLVLLLHGLNGHPAQFHALLASVRSASPSLDCVAPFVLRGGHGGVKELLEHPLRLVDEYVQRHGAGGGEEKEKPVPVALIGVSNGGRLACWAEAALRARHPLTPVLVSSVAGVIGGTEMMRLVRPLRWLNGYDPDVLDDFEVGSPSSRALCGAMAGIAEFEEEGFMRRITMYAATQDTRIVPWRHSLADIARNARIVTVTDHEHSSILFAVVEDQVKQLEMFFAHHNTEKPLAPAGSRSVT